VQVGNATGEFSFIGLAILAVLTSVAGAYYYLKVLVCMYMREESEPGKFEMAEDTGAKIALTAAAVLTLWLGVAPGAAIQAAREAVVDFGGASPALQKTLDDGAKQLEQIEQRSKASEQAPPSDEPMG
jgi:NADH-quinone oxidoreductase subunit N